MCLMLLKTLKDMQGDLDVDKQEQRYLLAV